MSKAVLDAICGRFGDKVLDTHTRLGDETALVDRSAIQDIARFIKDDPELAFDMPIDVTAVDYQGFDGPGSQSRQGARFEVVYHFYSTSRKHRIRLKVPLEEGDTTMPSVWPVFKGVDWFEREVYDMFGVVFEGHHDLRRMLLYAEFDGHPLRKDYPVRGYQPLMPIARLDPDNEEPRLIDEDLNP